MQRTSAIGAVILFGAVALVSVGALGAQHMKEAGAQGMGMPDANSPQMRQLQHNMMKLHDLMHQIRDAKTPQEREKLEAQQRELMQSQMRMMMPMMKPMMMQNMGGMQGGQGGMMGGPGMGGGMQDRHK